MSDAPSKYDGITTPGDWLCASCGMKREVHPRPNCPNFARTEYDFVAMLRVRNESRWIAEVIEGAMRLCRRAFVMDDHSEDNTVEVLKGLKDVEVFPSPFKGFNEARDKNWLFDQIMARCAPTWILCVDGDEILTQHSADVIRATVAPGSDCRAYSLQIVYLWNDRGTVRTDRVYGEFWRPSLFAPFHCLPDTPDHVTIQRELRFMATPFGRKRGDDEPCLHCSSVPQRFLHGHQRCNGAHLLHLGYMARADRVAKLDRYTALDWNCLAEDRYRHMTQGDNVQLDELPQTQALLQRGWITPADVQIMLDTPPGARLVHAGPLQLEPVGPWLERQK